MNRFLSVALGLIFTLTPAFTPAADVTLDGVPVFDGTTTETAVRPDLPAEAFTEGERVLRASGPSLGPDFINFGYLQSNSVLPYLHYESITHIATTFVNFGEAGTLLNPSAITGRSSHLKYGGSAFRAGTKVIACVRNDGFNEDILAAVMTSPSKRTLLVNQIRNLLINDSYIHGVNFDFEMLWGTSVRDGITIFLQEMRAALPPQYEISVYFHATYSSSRWDMPAITPLLDYVLYSTYDWATGSTVHTPSDFDNCLVQLNHYFNAGVPPEKMVLVWASYGRRWMNTTNYNQNNGGAGASSQGFYDGLYDTTLRQNNSGPYTSTYVRGDETAWYTQVRSGVNWGSVWESPEALEFKISSALNYPGYNGNMQGRRLGGVGWWSLMWMSNYSGSFVSYDPISGQNVSRPPYYRHVNQIIQEVLKAPGTRRHPLESFEIDNPHWRDPNESPDSAGDTDNNSTFEFVGAPSGTGRPAGTLYAGRLNFDFEGNAATNRLFVRHELLRNRYETSVTDVNATLGRLSKNTRIHGYYYVNGNYSSRNMRLALVDGNRQLEVSPAMPLPATPGWHTFTWDWNDPAQIQARTTAEPTLLNGNGVVNTAGPDARDVSFIGFIIEGGAAGDGTIYFDEITYENVAPGNKQYVINEFRYANNNQEFVEIAGPPGPFPSDMALISYNSTNGAVYKSTSLAGRSIPASGLFVVGDSGVPGATGSTGFTPAGWSTGDDIPDTAPGSLQLYGTSSGNVYDSVVYAAYGGIADLGRQQTRRVAGEGYPWIGNVATGLDAAGARHSAGRFPDGADTNQNNVDFALMPATPGQPNGAPDIVGDTYNFQTIPAALFQSYHQPSVVHPISNGLPLSPNGGNVYRCVDTAGGGTIGFMGNALMGAERGLDVTGELFIPAAAHPAQAVAVGFCGTQGSTFFTSNSPNGNGYENGYWLIYEHSNIALAHGQASHPGRFKFVSASHDNMDDHRTTLLGTEKTLAAVGATAGTWVTFRLRIDPTAPSGQQLQASINGVDVYKGAVPAGGRTSGAFMVGHREGGGGVANTEGTFVDNVSLQHVNPPASVIDYELY